ncbi:hypothetical protein N872_09275 [Neisseria meningitidis LNP27256]|nr:hypothetical protein N872_09275 [Neisseria meningitidis LNP27256]
MHPRIHAQTPPNDNPVRAKSDGCSNTAGLFPSGTKPSAMTADPDLSDTMKVCRPESQTSADRLICLFFIVLQKIRIYF